MTPKNSFKPNYLRNDLPIISLVIMLSEKCGGVGCYLLPHPEGLTDDIGNSVTQQIKALICLERDAMEKEGVLPGPGELGDFCSRNIKYKRAMSQQFLGV